MVDYSRSDIPGLPSDTFTFNTMRADLSTFADYYLDTSVIFVLYMGLFMVVLVILSSIGSFATMGIIYKQTLGRKMGNTQSFSMIKRKKKKTGEKEKLLSHTKTHPMRTLSSSSEEEYTAEIRPKFAFNLNEM